MPGTQKKRATVRPALPWFSLCAALVAVGVLLLLQDGSRGEGSHRAPTRGVLALGLRQALFGGVGTGSDVQRSDLASGDSTAQTSVRTAGGGFEPTAGPISASEATMSVPAGTLDGGEPGSAPATTPASGPAN